jgi:hypothetical protein
MWFSVRRRFYLLSTATDLQSKLAICDSLSLATVLLLNDLGASALESQNRKPDPGFGFRVLSRFFPQK